MSDGKLTYVGGTYDFTNKADGASALVLDGSTVKGDFVNTAIPPVVPTIVLTPVNAAGTPIPLESITTDTLFSFMAIPAVNVGSVVFGTFAGVQGFTEGSKPYAFIGNVGNTFNVQKFPEGKWTLKAEGRSGPNGSGVVICTGITPTIEVKKPVIPPPTDGIPQSPKDVAVFDRRTLKVLSTSDYTIKPGETIKLKKLVGKNLIVRLKKGEEAWVDSCLFDGGYVDQSNTGERYCIDANGNLGTLHVVNTEIKQSSSAGIYGDNFVCETSLLADHGADCSKPQNNAKFRQCYFADAGRDNPGSHADGGQTEDGNGVTYELCNINLVAGSRNGHTYKASQGIIFAASAGHTSKNLLVDTCQIFCTNTGILAYTDSGDGSSITIRNTVVTAKIPINAEKGANLVNNTENKIP